MRPNLRPVFVLVLALCLLHGSKGYGQSLNASLSGVVKDPSGAAVTNADLLTGSAVCAMHGERSKPGGRITSSVRTVRLVSPPSRTQVEMRA